MIVTKRIRTPITLSPCMLNNLILDFVTLVEGARVQIISDDKLRPGYKRFCTLLHWAPSPKTVKNLMKLCQAIFDSESLCFDV